MAGRKGAAEGVNGGGVEDGELLRSSGEEERDGRSEQQW
jgi:hypothetical protein